jgi:hypothetical protein
MKTQSKELLESISRSILTNLHGAQRMRGSTEERSH